jgi:catalase
VFGASSLTQLLGRLESVVPDPTTKAPNPVEVKAFADATPEMLLQGKHFASQPVPASFATFNFWGVHAFAFVDAKGNKQFGAWIFGSVGGVQGLSDDEAKAKDPTFLFDDQRQRVRTAGWRIILASGCGPTRRQIGQRHCAAARGTAQDDHRHAEGDLCLR